MSSVKWNRQYILAIQHGERQQGNTWVEGKEQIVINPFFTINVSIERGILSSVNKVSLDIYNLNESTRKKIYYDGILHGVIRKRIIMYLGYKERDNSIYGEPLVNQSFGQDLKYNVLGLPLVFFGRIIRAYSYRKGVDFITHIEAFDLPEKNELDISTEFAKGTDEKQLISFLASKLGVEKTFISPEFKIKFPRNKSLKSSSAWSSVNDIVKSVNNEIKKRNPLAPTFTMYHDYGTLYILRDDEVLSKETKLINAETGLLSTPIREGSKITFKSLFEPSFRAGGGVILESRTAPAGLSGNFKVTGFKHSGTVSPIQSGELTTEFTVFLGINKLKAV